MNKTLEQLLDVEQPVLTNALASKMQPYAKIIYLIGLVFVVGTVLSALQNLFSGEIYHALFAFVSAIIEWVLLRMCCEYLVSSK